MLLTHLANHSNLFERLAETVARLLRAPIAMVLLETGGEAVVLGSVGAQLSGWTLRNLDLQAMALGLKRIRIGRENRNLPIVQSLRSVVPTARELVILPVWPSRELCNAAIVVVDPKMSWPLTSELSSTLEQLGALLHHLIQLLHAPQTPASRFSISEGAAGFVAEGEQVSRDAEFAPEPTQQFLLTTLRKRLSMHSRGGITYFTSRTWRVPIKDQQIAALRALKTHLPPDFVAKVSEELGETIRRVHGTSHIDTVVGVACGHSLPDRCFSAKLAQMVAARLGCSYVDAFQATKREGTSHPRKNTGLGAMRLKSDIDVGERVVLVDDVATTGTHLERASKALSARAKHVMPIAWIGN
ncbi:MAG: phosphoribosyltransferase [Hyphomicrobiaceae bacterium]